MNTGKTIATDTLKNNVMTTKELAEALGVSTETVRTTAKKIIEPSKLIWRVINGGKSQIFDESQATAIKIELQNHSKIAQNGFDTFTIANDLEAWELQKRLDVYKDRRIAELTIENEKQKTLLIEQQPKVEFYDDVTGSKDTIDMKEVAKILNIKNIGRNKLFEILRNKNILDRFNQPYQKYVDAGYFRGIESRFNLPDGEIKISLKTVVFQKGLDFIRRELAKKRA